MMTVKLQIVVGLAILFILAILINMIRRRSLELKYALVWMLVLTALFVFDCAPALLNVVSGFLGIYAPVNMIFFLGFCFSLHVILLSSYYVSLLIYHCYINYIPPIYELLLSVIPDQQA